MIARSTQTPQRDKKSVQSVYGVANVRGEGEAMYIKKSDGGSHPRQSNLSDENKRNCIGWTELPGLFLDSVKAQKKERNSRERCRSPGGEEYRKEKY